MDKNFFTAGKAVFTVEPSPEFVAKFGCADHFTFRINVSKVNDKYPTPAYFVKLLTGPDNTSDYEYLGLLDAKNGDVRLSAKSCAGESAWSVKIIRRIMNQVFNGGGIEAIESHGWKVHHEGRCGRCLKLLTVPTSIMTGLGPDCAAKMGLVA